MLITFEVSQYEAEYVLPRSHSIAGFVILNWWQKDTDGMCAVPEVWVDFSDWAPSVHNEVATVQGERGKTLIGPLPGTFRNEISPHTNYPAEVPNAVTNNSDGTQTVHYTSQGHPGKHWIHLPGTGHTAVEASGWGGVPNPIPVNAQCDVPQRVRLRVLNAEKPYALDKDHPIMIQIDTLEVDPLMQGQQKNF